MYKVLTLFLKLEIFSSDKKKANIFPSNVGFLGIGVFESWPGLYDLKTFLFDHLSLKYMLGLYCSSLMIQTMNID